MRRMSRLVVRVPGSTSNLGHGFDCMGIAIGRHNLIEAVVTNEERCTSANGSGLVDLVEHVRLVLAQQWGQTPGALPSLQCRISGNVPISRGLGSSCTIVLACAAIWQHLAGRPADIAEVMQVGAAVEGHPDNVVASALGGFTCAAEVATAGAHETATVDTNPLRWQRLSMPADWCAVLTILIKKCRRTIHGKSSPRAQP